MPAEALSTSVLALSTSSSLLVLFVLLPFVVGSVVMGVISWRAPAVPRERRTSGLLAHGEAASGLVLDLRRLGSPLDARPMVAFRLEVRAGDATPFELIVTQPVPRRLAGRLVAGMAVGVRLSEDRAAGAVVLPDDV